MVSHKYKCIFIHIPKNAGTSIESALGHLDLYRGVREGQDHRTLRMIEQPFPTSHIFSSKDNIYEALRRVYHQNRTLKNPLNKLVVTREQYNHYFKFTFVRNPWARAYSWYENVMRDDIHKKRYHIKQQLSLNEFLRIFSGKGMLKPQMYWIRNFSGLIPLDFIGRFETLDEGFKKVCEAIHQPQLRLPHKNKGTTEDYREHYDKHSVNIIKRIYREEIEMFEYSF
ncbi:sulfotransferase family 2 domain-containing protein [bacterium]|nr:sulfotransferase family 2 domain-containing protein [bacterium]